MVKGRWKNSEYDEGMYYRRAEDGRIAAQVTQVDGILLVGDWENEVGQMMGQL